VSAPRITVRIPTPLRPFTGGADEVAVAAGTVGDALAELGRRHDGLLARVLDQRGELRPFVNVFVGPSSVRTLQGLRTSVHDGDVIAIVPAVAGGHDAGRGKSARAALRRRARSSTAHSWGRPHVGRPAGVVLWWGPWSSAPPRLARARFDAALTAGTLGREGRHRGGSI